MDLMAMASISRAFQRYRTQLLPKDRKEQGKSLMESELGWGATSHGESFAKGSKGFGGSVRARGLSMFQGLGKPHL